MKTLRNFFLVWLLWLSVGLSAEDTSSPFDSLPSLSAALPLSDASYYHFAKDQNLRDLIQDFFAMQGLNVIISDRVNAVVNGRFSKMNPKAFWDYITRAYSLVWFFDGKIMFVYSNAELQTHILRMDIDGIGTLAAILDRLQFVASDLSFRAVGEANVLIVTAPPRYISMIQDIASKFVPSKISDTTIVKIIPLKYAWAYDMTFNYVNGSLSVPGVASLLRAIVSGDESSTGMSPFTMDVGGKQNQAQTPQMVGIHNDVPQYAQDINKSIKNLQNSKNDSDTSGDKSSKSSDDKDVMNISGAVLPGFIICDQRLNAIMIRDRRENMPFYEEIITKLDVPCEVIKIDAAIVNVNKNWNRGMGINVLDFSGGTDKFAINGTSSLNDAGKLGQRLSIFNHGVDGIVKGFSMSYVIDAIENSGNGQTIAKPSVLTLDNVAAILETGKTCYKEIKGNNTSNAYTQSATTKLQVVPHIVPGDVDEHGKRKMKLFVDISDGDFGNDDSPDTVIQHSLNTQALLYEGQSLMVGGYNTENNSRSDSGVPILKDLPIIGMAFRRANDNKSVAERIYVISPSVVEIRSDDRTYDRYVQPGPFTAKPTLQSDEYFLDHKWPPERKKNRMLRLHR
jgi:type III secretion protein C